MAVKTVAYWFDGAGRPTGPADAVTGEIVETDEDGVVLRRTYLDDNAEAPGVISGDLSYDIQLESQDSSFEWDVRDPVTQEPATDLETLRRALGGGDDDAEWRHHLAGLLQLPSWDAAPAELKDEAYAWLVETRPTPGS